MVLVSLRVYSLKKIHSGSYWSTFSDIKPKTLWQEFRIVTFGVFRIADIWLCFLFGTWHTGRRRRGPPFGRHGWREWRADWLRKSRNRDRRGLNRRRNQNHWMGWKCHVNWCPICLCREWAWRCVVTWWRPKWRGSHIRLLCLNRRFVIKVFALSFVIWNLLLYDCQRVFSLVTLFSFL